MNDALSTRDSTEATRCVRTVPSATSCLTKPCMDDGPPCINIVVLLVWAGWLLARRWVKVPRVRARTPERLSWHMGTHSLLFLGQGCFMMLHGPLQESDTGKRYGRGDKVGVSRP